MNIFLITIRDVELKFIIMEQKDKECKKCGRVFGSVKCFDVDCPNNTPNITMNQENKELLLQDLCARSPHGVKFRYAYIDEFFHKKYGTSTLEGILPPYHIIHSTLVGEEYLQIERDEVKPYLYPMSSMTEEQEIIYGDLCYQIINATPFEIQKCFDELYDWLNKNHFDYRGLIEKGLAIDATGLNIY